MKRIIPLILVLAVLAGGLFFVRRADSKEQKQIASLYAEVEPLQKERANLLAERDTLVEEYKVSLRDPSTVQILFRDLRAEVFSAAYPIMREYNVIGVLGLSRKEFPDRDHRLTMEQFQRLQMDGWGTCLILDAGYDTQLESWLDYMQRHLERIGIALPKAIYFPEGNYDSATMDKALLAAGIETVVQNAEDGHSNTVTNVGSLWATGAMPWNYTGMSSDIELLSITDQGNLCLTVSVENLWDSFESKPFTQMLNSWQSFLLRSVGAELPATQTQPSPTPVLPGQAEPEIEPKLLVTSFEKARAAHKDAAEGVIRLVQEHEDAVAELESRIAELDKRIEETYARWNAK